MDTHRLDDNGCPGPGSLYEQYLRRAAQAQKDGDETLALHLNLAAYEAGRRAPGPEDPDRSLAALSKAWDLACSLRQRSLAEYIFEELEPYLSTEETARHFARLQEMALDRLEEFGLTRESLEEMAGAVAADMFGEDAPTLAHIESLPLPFGEMQAYLISDEAPKPAQPEKSSGTRLGSAEDASGKSSGIQAMVKGAPGPAPAVSGAKAQKKPEQPDTLTYHDLVGYDSIVSLMREFGVGMQNDPAFLEFTAMLNDRYGLDRMPATDTILFRSPVREDAYRFMMATVGEIGLPCVRMRMDENVQGMPVLCVMATGDGRQKGGFMRNGFTGPGILVLEDLDTWVSPMAEPAPDDFGGILMVSMSRGAREAVNVIRSAVEDPDVYVLACCGSTCEVDPFFYEMLEPLTVVDIDYPTEEERAAIWDEVFAKHPSLSAVDRDALVRYSSSMARYDMYMAANEAIDDAYKTSLAMRRYVPVTKENLFDKLAAYQPLDSKEYQALEDAVVDDFQKGLDSLEDYLNGKGGQD